MGYRQIILLGAGAPTILWARGPPLFARVGEVPKILWPLGQGGKGPVGIGIMKESPSADS